MMFYPRPNRPYLRSLRPRHPNPEPVLITCTTQPRELHPLVHVRIPDARAIYTKILKGPEISQLMLYIAGLPQCSLDGLATVFNKARVSPRYLGNPLSHLRHYNFAPLLLQSLLKLLVRIEDSIT